MIRIFGPGDSFPVPLREDRKDLDTERQLHDDRMGQQRPGRDISSGQSGIGANAGDQRETAFQEKMQQALGYAIDNAPFEDKTEHVLLASTGTSPHAPSAGRHEAAPSQTAAAGQAPWVGAVAHRIEQALMVPPIPAAPLTLRLDLPDGSGIGALSLTMTATSIDVVLIRSGGEASAELMQAAQALADRLHARFSRRIVRIHEVQAEAEARPSEGLDAISRLLQNPGTRS